MLHSHPTARSSSGNIKEEVRDIFYTVARDAVTTTVLFEIGKKAQRRIKISLDSMEIIKASETHNKRQVAVVHADQQDIGQFALKRLKEQGYL